MPASLRKSIRWLASLVKASWRRASSKLGVGRKSLTSALLAEKAASCATFSRILGYSSVRMLFSCINVYVFSGQQVGLSDLVSLVFLFFIVRYPRSKDTRGLCLSSTSIQHIFADVLLWFRHLTHQGVPTTRP